MIFRHVKHRFANYTFSSAIRYFLRHDPNVMLIGEIRDAETAATAVTASTTGHVFQAGGRLSSFRVLS